MINESEFEGLHSEGGSGANMPRLYGDLSSWWPVLSAPEDYAQEAAFYRKTIIAATRRSPMGVRQARTGSL
jgi:hypothetical protein